MTIPGGPPNHYGDTHSYWRPPPTPYVTHQDLGPLHTKVGALEKGQESILQAFAGYRAEILTRLDRIEAIAGKAHEPPQPKDQVSLTIRELILICIALVVAGGFLGRVLDPSQFLGG